MKEISLVSMDRYGEDFIPKEHVPSGSDQYTLRNMQNKKPHGYWRNLSNEEIKALAQNGNTSDDWNKVLVHDPFDAGMVTRSCFYGLIRIGSLERVALEHHDLRVPAGIADSFMLSCDIGNNCAIRNVRYAAHYIIGDRCILLNIGEMHVTSHAKFGNGVLKDGEGEDVRINLALMNEAGGREVLPFNGMIPADAYIWLRYRDDGTLQKRLLEITEKRFDSRRGYYGVIGDESVIKNCGIIKDVQAGSHCYIKGANKLKNLTINSSEAEQTQVGEGVELVNGIIGYKCRVFYGCKAVRFVLGRNSSLKYGARLIHSFLGDNSTVSCCEILHNLIFPSHEQHHNNSFLTSSCLLGQSNIAAGATIGSNHNSRANDGEILAGRGFWPGLCVTLKHSCRFASFVLLAKGDYPAEMNVPLPFSLVSDERSRDELHIMPAYFWMHNMYALERNSWKFKERDTRIIKEQKIEPLALAPDTAEEIFLAMKLIAAWTGRAFIRTKGGAIPSDQEAIEHEGRKILETAGEAFGFEVLASEIENSSRRVVIKKPKEAYTAYGDMLFYYAMKNIIDYMLAHTSSGLKETEKALSGNRKTSWVSLGGQLVPEDECGLLLSRIKSGEIDSWEGVHAAYDRLHEAYPLEKQKHGFATLASLLGSGRLAKEKWLYCLDRVLALEEHVRDQVFITRKKDYDNQFRRSTFRNEAEMRAVIGTPEQNSFIRLVRERTDQFAEIVKKLKERG